MEYKKTTEYLLKTLDRNECNRFIQFLKDSGMEEIAIMIIEEKFMEEFGELDDDDREDLMQEIAEDLWSAEQYDHEQAYTDLFDKITAGSSNYLIELTECLFDDYYNYVEQSILNENKRYKRISKRRLGKMIMESINKTLNENADSFYDEEDENGNTGEIGQVKSYDCGYMTLDNTENDAEEAGYPSVEEYLREWWNEAGSDAPFEWVTLGSGYGFHGSAIFEEPQSDGGTLRCKEIYGQIMFDVYPPQNLNESEEQPKKNKLLKHYTNGTDYDVCVFALKDNKYAVTVYDTVYREHKTEGKFNSQEEAIAKAKEINKAYRI